MSQNYFPQSLTFDPELAAQGFKLGMFGQNNSEDALQVLRTTPKTFEVPEGVNPDLAYVMQKLSPYTNRQEDWEQRKQELDYIAELQKKQAEQRQKFGEESTGKAVLYKALADIGPTIARAVNPGYLMESADRITRTANEAFRSVPSMNVQAPGYNMAQFKYF